MSHTETHLPIIGGRRIDCATRREVRSPWDDSLVGIVGNAGPMEILAAIDSVTEAAQIMARAPAHKRAEWLDAISAGLRRHEDSLVRSIVAEAGKPLELARLEFRRAVEVFSFASGEARRIGGEVIPLDAMAGGEGRIGLVRRVPVGPVAAISPFNFPLNLVAHKVAPAIAAGCSMVVKPASQTSITGLQLGAIALEAGLPAGAVDVVPCSSSDASALVSDDRIRALSFTGSDSVGWDLKAKAGQKRVLLELGGNAAAIVHDDAELDHAAARCAFGAFAYAGQICISVQRVLVHRRVLEPFLEKLLAATKSTVVGDPSDPSVTVGPVKSDADAERIVSWIDQAKDGGAKVLCGGERDGRVIAPTVMTDVDHSSPIWAEEIFGPVVAVAPYQDIEEALQMANRSRYGLQAGIFSQDTAVVTKAWERLEVGAIIHDDAPTFRMDHMPYGGVKSSGMGREGVKYAMEEMTEMRLLALRA